MNNNTTTYTDKFVDKYGRTIEYHVMNVPYLRKAETEEDEFIFLGAVLNRIIELRNNLRDLAETMNTEKKFWLVQIGYDTGRFKVVREGEPSRK